MKKNSVVVVSLILLLPLGCVRDTPWVQPDPPRHPSAQSVELHETMPAASLFGNKWYLAEREMLLNIQENGLPDATGSSWGLEGRAHDVDAAELHLH